MTLNTKCVAFVSHFFPVHIHVCYVSIHFFLFLDPLSTDVASILWPRTVSLCAAHLFHHVPDQGDINYLSLSL